MGNWPADADGFLCVNCGETRCQLHKDGKTISCPGCGAEDTMQSDGMGGIVFDDDRFETNPF